MDWKKELDKKMEQLNQKEEQNVQSRNINRNSNRNSIGRGGSIYLSERNRKIQVTNNDERSKKMISAAGVLKDYEVVVKEDTDASAKLVKIMRIVIKLLLNIRSNQCGGVKSEEIHKGETGHIGIQG